jgi:hypothetical protein
MPSLVERLYGQYLDGFTKAMSLKTDAVGVGPSGRISLNFRGRNWSSYPQSSLHSLNDDFNRCNYDYKPSETSSDVYWNSPPPSAPIVPGELEPRIISEAGLAHRASWKYIWIENLLKVPKHSLKCLLALEWLLSLLASQYLKPLIRYFLQRKQAACLMYNMSNSDIDPPAGMTRIRWKCVSLFCVGMASKITALTCISVVGRNYTMILLNSSKAVLSASKNF